jgi:catechol 2,3-dioxygenase
MAKRRTVFRCSECGQVAPKWVGRCPACDGWGTFVEEVEETGPGLAARAGGPADVPLPIDRVDHREAAPVPTGVAEVDPPKHAPGGGLWLRDPDGNLLNVREEAPATVAVEAPAAFNGPGYAPRQAARGAPGRDLAVAPRRLGHVLLFTPDMTRQVDFYTRVLGLKLSDRSGDIIAFMRCTTDHHNVALLTSSAPGFHHGSFEVGGVDEIGMGAARMVERGWQPGWGFGRHVIGSNFFYYIRDPWGSFAEYFYDLDQIPESCAWEPRDFPADDSLYIWGPPVPADFGENKEAST